MDGFRKLLAISEAILEVPSPRLGGDHLQGTGLTVAVDTNEVVAVESIPRGLRREFDEVLNSDCGHALLRKAVCASSEPIVSLLLRYGADINDFEYTTPPLLVAATRGVSRIVKYLMTKGALLEKAREFVTKFGFQPPDSGIVNYRALSVEILGCWSICGSIHVPLKVCECENA